MKIAISGFETKVLSAKMLRTGTPVKFAQDDLRVRYVGLPKAAPDSPVTTNRGRMRWRTEAGYR